MHEAHEATQDTPQHPSDLSQAGRRGHTVRKRLMPLVASFILIAGSLAVFHMAGPRTTRSSSVDQRGGTVTATATAGTGTPGLAAGWTRLATLPGTSSREGLIPSLAWSVADPDTLYLCRTALNFPARATQSGGAVLFRSDDRGHTWRQLVPPEPTASCMVQADPASVGQVILQDDHERAFVSRDGGAHWEVIPTPPNMPALFDQAAPIVIDHGRIFYGAYSTEDLKNWQLWDALDNVEPEAFAVDPAQVNLLYRLSGSCGAQSAQSTASAAGAASQYGVCVSHDGGHTWRLQLALARTPAERSLCTVPDMPNALYVWASGGTVSGGAPGLYFSQDAGAHWMRVSEYATDAGMPLPPPDAPCTAAVSLQIRDYTFTDRGQVLHLGARPVDIKGDSQGPYEIPAGVSLNTSAGWRQLTPFPVAMPSNVSVALFALPRSSGQAFDALALSPGWLLSASQPLP